ncbi:hypothetical protein, partial [Alteromonas genovensis]
LAQGGTMKLVLFLITLFFTPLIFGNEIEIPNSSISFSAPKGFQPFSKEVIEAKWPARRAPEWVIGSESTSTSIAFGLRPNDISNTPLKKLKDYLKQTMSRIGPGVVWLRAEVISINGKDWVYLEFTSNAINADIHNIILASSHRDKMAMFNFNSTKDEFSKYEDALKESIESITYQD